MTNQEKNSLAILVLSCDKNHDLWNPFFSLFHKYWPDCKYNVYLGTNFLNYNDPLIKTLNSNESSDWSSEFKIILRKIPEQYVMIILEDYFIYKAVSLKEIDEAFEIMKTNNAKFIMLACFPSKYRSLWNYKLLADNSRYARISRSSEYLVNLQIGIWDRNILSGLLLNGESPWQFELNGSKRFSEKNYLSLCIKEDKWKTYVHGPITYLCGALTKGVVMRDAIRLCKRENVDFVVENKKIETAFEEIKRRVYIGLPLIARKIIGRLKLALK